MDLSGAWRAAPADDDLRRDATGFGADDAGWADITVPGHWRSHPDFADSDGPVLYRHRFHAPAPGSGRRRWITFDGVFYQADVWLDGAYLGDPEGTFSPTAFEVTDACEHTTDHVLAVEVSCPPVTGRRGKRSITGIYQGPDGIDPEWNPGGLAGPVHLVDTGPVRIDRFRVLCRDADPSRAHLLLATRLDAATTGSAIIRTLVDGTVTAEFERELAGGANDVAWNVDVDRPSLWWPRSVGPRHLTEVSVEILVNGATSDAACRRTGLREVAWSRRVCSVNGERIFLKGANLLPVSRTPAEASVDDVRRQIERAVDLGLDAVRVHGHVARPELYEAADEHGVLVLQDFPLTAGYARSVRGRAVDQARDMVDRLGHHPSIVAWAAHDDPDARDHDPGGVGGRLRRLTAAQLPSWNRTVLDRWVKRAIERADPTRPCDANSGVPPHLLQLDGADAHVWSGWAYGDLTDLARTARRVPRMVRFVTEFGAQSIPADTSFLEPPPGAWPTRDALERHGAELDLLQLHTPPGDDEPFDHWAARTRHYHAELVRHHVETLRRLKYRPTGGFCVFALDEPVERISAALIDHAGTPTPAWHAMRDACAPVVVVADRPPEILEPEDRLRLDVHVVNDLRVELEPAAVEVVARWNGGERVWWFGGDVPADDCIRVGRIAMRVPDASGTFELFLRLVAGVHRVENRYTSTIRTD